MTIYWLHRNWMARNMFLIIVILLTDKHYLVKSKLDVHWGTLMQTIPKTKFKHALVHNKAFMYNRDVLLKGLSTSEQTDMSVFCHLSSQ